MPNCAPGEWGPLRALTMFGLNPVSHRYAEINAAPPSNIDIKTEVRPLTLPIGNYENNDYLSISGTAKNIMLEKRLQINTLRLFLIFSFYLSLSF